MANELDAHATTYGADQRFYAENMLTERTYCRRIIEALQQRPAVRLLSLGLGHGLTARELHAGLAGRLARHVVLEGSPEMIERFSRQADAPRGMEIVETFFETYETVDRFDAIEMGFVLEHVEDPALLLRRYRDVLADDGRLFIGVPNALSLHRKLGHMAGMLPNPYELGEMDLKYGHRRYFDLESLGACVVNAGYRVISAQGLFMKPFTERQLQSLDLAAAVWVALAEVSRDYPAIANAIFIEAGK